MMRMISNYFDPTSRASTKTTSPQTLNHQKLYENMTLLWNWMEKPPRKIQEGNDRVRNNKSPGINCVPPN